MKSALKKGIVQSLLFILVVVISAHALPGFVKFQSYGGLLTTTLVFEILLYFAPKLRDHVTRLLCYLWDIVVKKVSEGERNWENPDDISVYRVSILAYGGLTLITLGLSITLCGKSLQVYGVIGHLVIMAPVWVQEFLKLGFDLKKVVGGQPAQLY